jgi:hypothetical protein
VQAASGLRKIGYSEVVHVLLPEVGGGDAEGLTDLEELFSLESIDLQALEEELADAPLWQTWPGDEWLTELLSAELLSGDLLSADSTLEGQPGFCRACGAGLKPGAGKCGSCGAVCGGVGTGAGRPAVARGAPVPGRGTSGGGRPGGGLAVLAPPRRRGDGGADGAPVVEPAPPRYEASSITATTGRKIKGKEVKANPDEQEAPSTPEGDGEKELTAGDRQVDEKGRAIDASALKALPRTRRALRQELSATEIERRISRYSDFAQKLTAEEKRVVREYYKRLRDLK